MRTVEAAGWLIVQEPVCCIAAPKEAHYVPMQA